jgi:ABC-2 type transport system permease protein
MKLFAAARIIARRDYFATVVSRTFLLFLLGPLLPILFSIAYIAFAGHVGPDDPARPMVALAMDRSGTLAVIDAAARIEHQVDGDLPMLSPADPRHPSQALADRNVAAVLSGTLDRPVIEGAPGPVKEVTSGLRLILDDARRQAALSHAGIVTEPVQPILRTVAPPPRKPGKSDGNERAVARTGQTVLFVLTLMLANMLLWNLVEEKSNKVMEVLAAAVPVRAIFVGKLIGMLAISLTAVFAWAGTAVLAIFAAQHFGALPPDLVLPAPAIGLPAYALLMLFYFIASYLLFGGVLLGVGAQLSSMREIQSVTLPATMIQLVLFVLASSVVGHPDSPVALGAAIFPLTSPLVMIARAGELPALWPHLLALAWQAAWIALIIAFAAERFRRGVLQSGPVRRA